LDVLLIRENSIKYKILIIINNKYITGRNNRGITIIYFLN
jgi:hypothetical protein